MHKHFEVKHNGEMRLGMQLLEGLSERAALVLERNMIGLQGGCMCGVSFIEKFLAL